MLWVITGTVGALFNALSDVVAKKVLAKADPFVISFVYLLFPLPIFALVYILDPVESVTVTFWVVLVIKAFLDAFGQVLKFKAIQLADLSLVKPMLALTPAFLLIISPFFLGEVPPLLGIIGVLLIVVGTYFLQYKKNQQSFFAPFTSLAKNKGTRYMLYVSVIWSLTNVLHKMGIQNSSISAWAFAGTLSVLMVLSPFALKSIRKDLGIITGHMPSLSLLGLFGALSVLFQLWTMSLVFVSYAVAIKRLSVVFGVVLGFIFFKEKDIKQRFFSSIIILAGVVLIALA